MIRTSKSLFAALAFTASALFSTTASAGTTYSVDFTDMWWNNTESGWGVNLTQQYDTIFATLFVYGTDGTARWFAGSATGGGSSFGGTLYQTTGPYFGAGSFNQAAVTFTAVGSFSLNFTSEANGTLTYTVSGVTVSKPIMRQQMRNNVISGRYLGGLTATGSGCSGVADGPILIFDQLNISQSGLSATMTVDFFTSGGTAARCTFNGSMTNSGRFMNMTGTWSCTTGNSGTFSMGQIDASINGLNATFSGRDQFCSYSGRFGGVRDQ